MYMKKVFKTAMAMTLVCSMLAGSTGMTALAADNTARVSIGTDKVSISNGYIAREFAVEDGKIKTAAVLNKRIGTTLEPQEGSEDFVIRTISSGAEQEDPDVIKNEPEWVYPEAGPIAKDGWSATLVNKDGEPFSDTEVAKLFDGNKATNIDNYLISGYPFTLDIDFGEEQTISSMSVDKRPGYVDSAYGINGTMGGYEIWTSADGEEYTQIKEGTFTEDDYELHEADGLYNVGNTVYTTFEQVTTRYVRVVQTSAAMGNPEEFTSAEIGFYRETTEPVQKVTEPSAVIDRVNWDVSIRNSAGTEFSADQVSKLIDGNLNTHPDEYTKSGLPITVDIDLGEEKTIRSFSVDKRPGYTDPAYGTNGTMGSFELYVSADGVNYSLAGAGEFTAAAYNLHQEGELYNVGDRVYANFYKPYTTRYVRLVQTGVAIGSAQEFTSAELNLYEDQYYGPNWNTAITPVLEESISSGRLTYKNADSADIEGGKKLTIHYEPYLLNGVTYSISQVLVLKDHDPYLRSFLEISVSDMDSAQIDYIDTDRFVLPADVEGLWSHPEESKISSMWIGKHELMLGQPIYANGFFMGSEFPAADTLVTDNTTQIRYYSGKTFSRMKADHQLTTDDKFVSWQNVIGAAQGTETAVVQTDFFAYIEDIATPTEFRKQYNSWYDNMMDITDESIASSFNGAEAGLTQNGVEPLDAYVVDDGWNNYYSVIGSTTYVGAGSSAGTGTPNQTGFWEFNTKFPNELYTSSALSDKFQSAFGLWLGPQGGYNYFTGFAQYLEAKGTGYAQSDYWTNVCVGSDRYVKNLRNLFIDYQERFNIDYWKWDGFALRPCTNAAHDHMTGGYQNMYYTTDLWEKWTDLFDAVRAARAEEGKGLFINATCYVNLSPWLLQWVNTIWVQDSGDTGELGTGERHEQKIYYRDQVYYQLYKQNQIQFPLKNIYNHDPIYGVSDNSNATTDVFREYLFANAVRGTAFWELYFSPSIMDDAKWMVVTDVLAWAEENHEILKNAKLFGNQPRNGVYGYSSWNGNEGIISFTNPLSTEQTYSLTVDEIVGAPETVDQLTGIQVEPYRTGTMEKKLSYGDTLTVALQPHETIIYQFGHEDEAAPEIISAKVTGDHTVTLKFNERIQSGQFTVDGKAAETELKEDYRTVVLTTQTALKEECKVAVNAADFCGNTLSEKLSIPCYENGVIAQVMTPEDLVNGSNVKTGYDAVADITWLKDISKQYEADTDNTLSGKGDFTISASVRTESTNVDLVKSGNDVSLSIDADGFVKFKVNGLVLSSKEEVTTVTQKAHGTFGTEEYVPTTTSKNVIGTVNDGESHAIDAVREANGMLKLYIDGRLAASLYEEDHINEAVTGGKITVGDESLRGALAQVQVLNRAVAYDEVHTAFAAGAERIESDRDGWTATACSEMPGMSGDASAAAAVDGNSNSWWHTNYTGGDSHGYGTHWIQVNFNREESFDKFIYTGRGAASNGSIKDYKLELLDEEGNVTKTFTGTFSSEEATTEADLGELCTAYGVRLTAVTTHNGRNFAAAVEINVSKPVEILSGEELKGQVEDMLSLVEEISYEDYTKDTSEALKKVVNKLESLERIKKEDLQKLNSELEEAKADLVEIKGLKEAIEKANAAKENKEKYQAASYQKMLEALAVAESAANNGTAKEVAAAQEKLEAAIKGLVLLSGGTTGGGGSQGSSSGNTSNGSTSNGNPSNGSQTTGTNAPTGDHAQPALYVGLLMTAAVAAVVVYGRKKQGR